MNIVISSFLMSVKHAGTMQSQNNVPVKNVKKKANDTDMIFVKNFTLPDFQAKNFTTQKCVICDIFSCKLTT